jgi:hypothetical protein
MPTVKSLKPYRSFVLGQVKNGVATDNLLNAILDQVKEALKLDGAKRTVITTSKAKQDQGLETAFVCFSERNVSPWTIDSSVVDVLNHLVVISRYNRFCSICFSDSSFRLPIVNRFDKDDSTGLGALRPIEQGIVNAAFVQGGTLTLWLSGTHRRTPVKADSKVLSGVNLRDALNPLEDQSYYFTAARSRANVEGKEVPIGASPRKSRVWLGPTRDWPEFRDSVLSLLKHLESTKKPVAAPLPVVAITSIDAGKIKNAFDLSLAPMELTSDDVTLDAARRQNMEKWSYESDFEITSTTGVNLAANIRLKGQLLGSLEFTFNTTSPDRVSWQVTGEPDSEEVRELHATAVDLCSDPSWLKVWYESGHTISDGEVFEIRHRDMPFRNFKWANLGNFDVTREKPEPLDQIGTQDSLFCWTQLHWPNLDRGRTHPRGWLASDDGAMEIADFIHLANEGERPLLSLIHVKGAGSAAPNRGLSVSKYEIVTGQAVKNLRSLDRLILEDGMRGGMRKKVGALVWHNGRRSTRDRMLDALSEIGTDYDSQVVILQPHLTRTRYNEARQHPKSRDAARLRQLDTLLLSADASVRGVAGASLVAVGQL